MLQKPERFTVQPSGVFPDKYVVLDTQTGMLAKKNTNDERPWRYPTMAKAENKALDLNRAWRKTLTQAQLNPEQQSLLPEPKPEKRKVRRATRRKK